MKRLPFIFKPINMVILVNIMAFTLLYFYKEEQDKKLLLAGFTIILMIAATHFIIAKKEMGDGYLFPVVAMLASLGVLMIYRLDRVQGFKQIVWFGIGILLFFAGYAAYIRFERRKELIYLYIGGAFFLFLLTLVMGKSIKGANNWIVIGGYSFQPSELIKIIYIFFLAAYFYNPEKLAIKSLDAMIMKKIFPKAQEGDLTGKGPSKRIVLTAAAYMFMGFLVLQREWGTALLFFAIFFVMLYVLDHRLDYLLANSVLACAGAVVGYRFLYHIRVRFDTWLNPWADIANKGYQITQSLFAIGAGGFFGTGIGMGRPDFIPEVHTDFIFSAICEEMGIFGGAAVILLYFILTYRGFKVALAEKCVFEKAVALGITVMFGFQTFIIIGGVIKLIPLTGITLPFISYGGSSMTTSFIALGVLQAISGSVGLRGGEEMDADDGK